MSTDLLRYTVFFASMAATGYTYKHKLPVTPVLYVLPFILMQAALAETQSTWLRLFVFLGSLSIIGMILLFGLKRLDQNGKPEAQK